MVALVVVVKDLERLGAAGRQEKVVPAHPVLEDREHGVAAVGVENVARREVDGVVVVDAAPGGESLRGVLGGERHNVRDLLPLRVNDPQHLPPPQLQADPRLRSQVVARRLAHSSESFSVVSSTPAWKGQRQSGSAGRPEYWRASERTPKSPRFGLRSPWSASSLARITSCMRP